MHRSKTVDTTRSALNRSLLIGQKMMDNPGRYLCILLQGFVNRAAVESRVPSRFTSGPFLCMQIQALEWLWRHDFASMFLALMWLVNIG